MTTQSPWWYRRRSFVIFLIYLAGFYIGGLFSPYATLHGYVPTYYWIALRSGVNAHALLWLAAALAVMGFAIRLWGSSYLSAEVVWNANALDNRLIVDGPFRYIRNPLYFGNNLLAIGVGMLASPYGFAFIVVANVLFTILLAAHESKVMVERYGVVYERFRAAVPSMFPRLTPATVEGSVRATPSIGNGIRSELLMLGFAIGMLAIAVVGLRALPFFGACWILGWLLQTALRMRLDPRSA